MGSYVQVWQRLFSGRRPSFPADAVLTGTYTCLPVCAVRSHTPLAPRHAGDLWSSRRCASCSFNAGGHGKLVNFFKQTSPGDRECPQISMQIIMALEQQGGLLRDTMAIAGTWA
ncbi:hypothetical protein GJAV_G00071780 [Gymnothorax javanicus]|nr:hypothetical protein GJAV_G00071780 [Gymnothorax javanicus]